MAAKDNSNGQTHDGEQPDADKNSHPKFHVEPAPTQSSTDSKTASGGKKSRSDGDSADSTRTQEEADSKGERRELENQATRGDA